MTNTVKCFDKPEFANRIDTTGNFTDIQCFEMFGVDMTLAPANPNTLGQRGAMLESDVRDKNRFLWNTKKQDKKTTRSLDKVAKADRLAAHAARINNNKLLIEDGREDETDQPLMLDTLVDLMGKMDLDI